MMSLFNLKNMKSKQWNNMSSHRIISCLLLIFLVMGCAGAPEQTAAPNAPQPLESATTLTAVVNDTTTQTPTSSETVPTAANESDKSTIRIPEQSDWMDCGVIFEAGAEGEWDYYLWGGFAFSLIKNGDTFFLYYQGASGYREAYDETVLWRAIGVATSTDGIHYSKYEGNPILTWFPSQNGEEGAVSSGVTFGPNGETILFYGANSAETPITVNADSRVAISLDGLSFKDVGVALNRKNRSVWGSGDELFVVDAIYHDGQWILYYIPNGTAAKGLLGVSYGSGYDDLNHSEPVTDGDRRISVWGTAGHAQIDEDTYAIILNNVREKRTEIRLMSPQNPALLSKPVATYSFPEAQQANFLLDKDNMIWYLYYRTYENSYGVKLAAAIDGPIQKTCTSQEGQ
jgi:hypothetical protein